MAVVAVEAAAELFFSKPWTSSTTSHISWLSQRNGMNKIINNK